MTCVGGPTWRISNLSWQVMQPCWMLAKSRGKPNVLPQCLPPSRWTSCRFKHLRLNWPALSSIAGLCWLDFSFCIFHLPPLLKMRHGWRIVFDVFKNSLYITLSSSYVCSCPPAHQILVIDPRQAGTAAGTSAVKRCQTSTGSLDASPVRQGTTAGCIDTLDLCSPTRPWQSTRHSMVSRPSMVIYGHLLRSCADLHIE